MSNIPTPKEIPPTPEQVDRTLQSVISAAQKLISSDPRHFANLRSSFLAMYTHPTFQLILGIPSQVSANSAPPNNQIQSELTVIKSSILALSKTVADLQPKVTGAKAPTSQPTPSTGNPGAQGKGPPPLRNPTYASKAASKPRPSLVLDIGATNHDDQLDPSLNEALNGHMHKLGRDEIKFSAIKYNKKGNLILTAHHTTTQAQLNSIADEISQFVTDYADTRGTPLPETFNTRPNVKWSKILINSVPTGITDSRGPFTSDECHRSLVAHNPSYATLTITQKPSWVRPPSTLKANTHSSLVVAFEDQDGTTRRSLLSNKQLFILGARAKVSRWKDNKHNPHTTHTPAPAISFPSTPPRHSAKKDDTESSTPVANKTRSKRQLATAAKITSPFPKLSQMGIDD